MNMQPVRAFSIAMTIVAAVFAPIADAQSPSLIVDYESGTADSNIPNIEVTAATAPDAAFASIAFARSGFYSVGHKVNLDDPAYVSYGKPRSETATDRVPTAVYRNADHRRYTFSLLLNDWQDWVGGSTPIDILWQFKHVNGAPDIFIGVRRNQMVLRYGSNQVVLIDDIRPYDNKWIDFRFDVLWSNRPDGYFTADMRLDGQTDFTRKATVTRYATFDPAAAGQHGVLQWGLYRPDATTAGGAPLTRIVYHDDITVTPLPSPTIRLNKAFGRGGRFGANDQFTLSIAGPAPALTADTSGTGARVTSPALALIAPVPGATYVLSESAAAGAPGTDLSNYQSSYACTNANAGGIAPRGVGPSFSVVLTAQDDLTCTFTNTRNPAADLSVSMTNTPAAGEGDQADDTVMRGSTSTYRIVVSNGGPDATTGAIVRSAALAGLSCAGPASCAGTACPAPTVPVDVLRGDGAVLGRLGNGERVDLSLDCRVD